jgi:hypothetical protein
MFHRIVTTPPELVAAGGSLTFRIPIAAAKLRIESDFPAVIDIETDRGRKRSAQLTSPRLTITFRPPEQAQYITITLPGGWSTVAQVAARHGWILIEAMEEGVDLAAIQASDGIEWNVNIHNVLLNGAADDATTMFIGPGSANPGVFLLNGRVPDMCWLLDATVYTHDADETPVYHDVYRMALAKFPVNPVGVPQDAHILLDMACDSTTAGAAGVATGRWRYSGASPRKFPLRSVFASYGAGDTTPQLALTTWHAFLAPAGTQATVNLALSGIVI